MEIEGAIFDMDGTLLDTMPVWRSLTYRYLTSLGIEVKEGVDREIGYTSEASVRYLKNNHGIRKTAAEVTEGKYLILKHVYFHEAQAKPGVADYLERLAVHGVRMCVVTQTSRDLAAAALERCALLKYFINIISCSDFGSGKDQPEIFEHALSMLGTPREKTPVYEDALYAASTAKAAGFPVVAVYDKSCREPEELYRLADRYVMSMQELV